MAKVPEAVSVPWGWRARLPQFPSNPTPPKTFRPEAAKNRAAGEPVSIPTATEAMFDTFTAD